MKKLTQGPQMAEPKITARSKMSTPRTTHLLIVIVLLIMTITAPAVAHGSDRDGDGLADDEERVFNTGIDNRDSDNDGLIDGVEVYATKTDPLTPDTDGDGFTDGEEDRLGSNPTDQEDTPDFWDRIRHSEYILYLIIGLISIGGMGILAFFQRNQLYEIINND